MTIPFTVSNPTPRSRKRKPKPAPDWFGCGRVITTESWKGFLKARAEYYAKEDARNALCNPS